MSPLSILFVLLVWITTVLATSKSTYPWPNFHRQVTQIPKLHERLLQNFKTIEPKLPMEMVLLRPCLQNPCLNGGRCTYNTQHGVRCLCTHFYVGDNCEHRLPPPSNVTMTRASPDSVTISWTGPKVPIDISGFRIQYNMFGEGYTKHSQLIHPNVFNYSIMGLLPRTQYTVCVNIVLKNITMREAILRDQCVEVMTTNEYIANLDWKTVTVLVAILVFIFASILIIALMIQRRRLLKYYLRTVKITPAPVELMKKIEITKVTQPSVVSNTLPMHTKTVCNNDLPVFRRAQTQTCNLDRVDLVHQHTQTPPIVERHNKPSRGKNLSSCSGYSSNSSSSSSSMRYGNNYTPCPSRPPVIPDHININMEERKMAFTVATNDDTTQRKLCRSIKAQHTATFATTARFLSNRENEDSDNEGTVPYFLPRFNTSYQTNSFHGMLE
ncbi:uncharacterized protein [Antedon mediterranea]|uniref:uncharacterized protein n=1 Tax=Antedon mediterranea TaxID=105859 RepID=UPI003AF88EB5